MTPFAFRALAYDGQAERWVPEALPWVHEAGNPYYWFFGGPEQALAVLGDWTRQTSLEVFIGRPPRTGNASSPDAADLGALQARPGRHLLPQQDGVEAAAQGEGRGRVIPRDTCPPARAWDSGGSASTCAPATPRRSVSTAAGFRVSRSGEAAMTNLRMNLELNHAWQDSMDERADGGRTALGSQRQDGR